MTIIYFVDNKLGGVTSLNYNLASHPLAESRQIVIHIDQQEWTMSRANIRFPVDKEIYFSYSGDENTYSSIKNLSKIIPRVKGALILNYENEMVVLDNYSFPQTTYQLVHDNYNLNLAKKYGHVSDIFICHNTVIYDELHRSLPARKSDIYYFPHGVNIPSSFRKHGDNKLHPLKLLFLGRMTFAKGIFDLPLISKLLRERSIKFEWICIGNGPELNALKEQWDPKDKVTFLSPPANKEVLEICAQNDVFVLPTRFEGSPVSLLETMSAGLVPVVSRIPGGITDIVKDDIGYTIPVGDNEAFADAISELYFDRKLLKTLSENCRIKIEKDFDINTTSKKYHELFLRYEEFYKIKEKKKLKIGARLDHPLIPSYFSKTIRRISRRIK